MPASGDTLGLAAVAGVVDRPRLYRILDAPRTRVCVLEGPSGIGKTTLLRSWLLRQADDMPLAWIPLESGIDTRQEFWRHVVRTAKRLGALAEDSARRVNDMLTAAADPVDVAVDLLRNAGPVTLVLDAYEHLGETMADVDRDLTRLARALPDLRLLITTRGHTAVADIELPALDTVRVITMSDLALTAEEIGTLLAEQTGIEDDRIVHSVAESTRGYALTVRAAALALSRLGRIPHIGSMDWDAVMAARLEAQLPDAAAVRFVTDTSVAPYVDGELARRLTGHAAATEMLDVLERNGFGRWIPYARNRPVFQYVETIRDVFRARAAEDTDAFQRSCVTIAQWLREDDDIDQALFFALEGRDYPLADAVCAQVVTARPDSYITSRYLTMLRTVPEAELAERPMLAFGLGLALTASALLRSEAPRIMRIAAESTVRPAYFEPSVDDFSMAAMRAIAQRLALSFRASAEAAAQVAERVGELDERLLPVFGDHLGTVLRQLSYSILQGGRIDEALAVMTRSVVLGATQTARNYSMAYAAGASAFAGDLARARLHLGAIDRDAWPEDLRRSYMTGLGLVAEGHLRLDALEFDDVLDLLRDVDVFMPQAEFWPFHTALSVAARHGVGQGRAEAERVMAELAAPFPPPGVGDNVATESLYGVLAHTLIAEGDQRAAARLLDGQRADSPHLASARVALRLAEDHAAMAGEARSLLELPGHTIRTRAATQTFAAAAALRQDDAETAWNWLASATVTAEAHGPRAHVALVPAPHLQRLQAFAQDRRSLSAQRYLEVPARMIREGSRLAAALTPRETAVLAAFEEHGSVRRVAEALVVSPHTVKSQLQSVYRKLGVSSRRAALAAARDQGILGTTA